MQKRMFEVYNENKFIVEVNSNINNDAEEIVEAPKGSPSELYVKSGNPNVTPRINLLKFIGDFSFMKALQDKKIYIGKYRKDEIDATNTINKVIPNETILQKEVCVDIVINKKLNVKIIFTVVEWDIYTLDFRRNPGISSGRVIY